jgi:type II secretory pathway pseudopilin PulG
MGQKRSLTLIEIMVVIFLIGLVASVVGYNMKGSLDKGKAFKTEQTIEKVRDILLMQMDEAPSIDDLICRPEVYLARSPLVKNAQELLKDGWGKRLKIEREGNCDLRITSDAYEAYKAEHPQ